MGKYIGIIESKTVVHIQFNTRTHSLFFYHQPEHYAVKRKNIVLPSDVKKVQLNCLC